MDSCNIFNETSLPGKRKLHFTFNIEKITNADYEHAKRYEKNFEIFKNLIFIMIYVIKATHYYLQTHLKVLATGVLKYMNLIQLLFDQHQD